MRLVPGTGQWTLNGRSLEDYFPNKLHQQLVRAPFTILDLEGRFDVVARINGVASPARPVPCAWASPARSTRSTVRPTAPP